MELRFEHKNFYFIPGQYVSFAMEDWRWKFSRSYSITMWSETHFMITVKILDKWRWANYLKKLKIWHSVNHLQALWWFNIQKTKKEKLFFATWTGISPIIAMLLATPKSVKKTIYFWVRYEKDIFYKDLLESIENTKVVLKISKPWEDFTNFKWRVTDHLDEVSKDAEVYICWNQQMVESVKLWLINNHHSKDLIFTEVFVLSKNFPPFYKDIIFNWNIPWINLLSWIIILWTLVWVPIVWNNWFQNILWNISWWSVVFVMAIRPISDIFQKIWLFRELIKLRKAFGILTSMIVVTALFYKFYHNPNFFFHYFSLNKWNLYYPILWRISEITWLILLVTSNNFSQKYLWKLWKPIQRTSYLYFLSWWLIIAQYNPFEVYITMWIVILLWIIAQVKLYKNKD